MGRSLAARYFAGLLLAPLERLGQPAPAVAARVQQSNHPDLLWVEPTYLHQGKRLSAAEAAEQGVKRKSPPEIRLEQVREVDAVFGSSAVRGTAIGGGFGRC